MNPMLAQMACNGHEGVIIRTIIPPLDTNTGAFSKVNADNGAPGGSQCQRMEILLPRNDVEMPLNQPDQFLHGQNGVGEWCKSREGKINFPFPQQ